MLDRFSLKATRRSCGSARDMVYDGMDLEREAAIQRRWARVGDDLDERVRRRVAAAEALEFGRGGVAAVVRATGLARNTVRAGIADIEGRAEAVEPGRVRRPGGGRTREVVKDKTLYADLDSLIEPATRGDPMNPLRWTSKSLRRLVDELQKKGHRTSTFMVSNLLHDLGYSLQANQKTLEGTDHADRDAQFNYINEQVKAFQQAGEPVISVDAKKKELVGNYKNGGQELRRVGNPEKVNGHDFIGEGGRVTPYGIYDITLNDGWVSVGTDHDTAKFAVQSIRRWWWAQGIVAYPNAEKLLINADGGGSNGSRVRLWKVELQKLATELGISITVSHFPPGTSKWNKIEHRMFSHISMNWRGKPLIDHQTILSLIGATTTTKGLRIHAEMDPGIYPLGEKVPDHVMDALSLHRHLFHPEWNYTLRPEGDIG